VAVAGRLGPVGGMPKRAPRRVDCLAYTVNQCMISIV